MKPLTKVQKDVYDFIVSYKSSYGIPPTRAEIAGEFGWASNNAAECHLKLIAKKGWITMLGHKRSRGLVVSPQVKTRAFRKLEPFEQKPTTLIE